MRVTVKSQDSATCLCARECINVTVIVNGLDGCCWMSSGTASELPRCPASMCCTICTNPQTISTSECLQSPQFSLNPAVCCDCALYLQNQSSISSTVLAWCSLWHTRHTHGCGPRSILLPSLHCMSRSCSIPCRSRSCFGRYRLFGGWPCHRQGAWRVQENLYSRMGNSAWLHTHPL